MRGEAQAVLLRRAAIDLHGSNPSDAHDPGSFQTMKHSSQVEAGIDSAQITEHSSHRDFTSLVIDRARVGQGTTS